ncbi:MAG: hypothetical protein J6B16_00855, partial [Clostridia bacterium]|nr:hypothetical protein [Clostridia bacterium]
LMLMIYSYSIDLRILFKKFYCPICGQKLKVVKKANKLSSEQKNLYYKQLFPMAVPIDLDVAKVEQIFKCHKCNYYNTTDNQLIIRKKQRKLRRRILSKNELQLLPLIEDTDPNLAKELYK